MNAEEFLHMNELSKTAVLLLSGLALLLSSGAGMAGYKARGWSANAREFYTASLTSEGVTIAADPFYTDAQAARVFDKKDIVTRGIMPVAIIIFNDNDYPIEIDGLSVELIRGDEHYPSLSPFDAVNRLFGKSKSPLTGSASRVENVEALKDFEDKFLRELSVPPHEKAGGFAFFRIYNPKDLQDYLSTATVYIPNIYRGDDGSPLIFFEIELKPVLKRAKQN